MIAEFAREDLQMLQDLQRAADESLERAVRGRFSLSRTLDSFLPAMGAQLGAKGAFVRTQNEEMSEETYRWGEAGQPRAEWPDGVSLLEGRTLVQRPLDVAESRVGTIGFLFDGDQRARAPLLEESVEMIAEQLDGILGTIHLAAEKQGLILRISQALSSRVFEKGLDAAVDVLFANLQLSTFAVCWRDDVGSRADAHYRVYSKDGLLFDSEDKRHEALEQAFQVKGRAIFTADDHTLRSSLGLARGVEAVLIEGSSDLLGKILVGADDGGLSTFAHDLVRVFGECISQRLVDFNRERRHLAQFFSAPVIGQLLHEPDYVKKYLTARESECAVIYADINGFTRISEQVLETPEKIGRFVDKWSGEAVARIWAHGGVFDKMVGDCVIGIFGPPFGERSGAECALAALRTAHEIQALTTAMETGDPDLGRIRGTAGMQGLGVAIGVNLCQLFVGLFGPNQDFTGFSSGMNSTARLQSLAGFRETLAMESVRKAVSGLDDAYVRALAFGEAREAAVKNVRQPLKYHRVEFPETRQ